MGPGELGMIVYLHIPPRLERVGRVPEELRSVERRVEQVDGAFFEEHPANELADVGLPHRHLPLGMRNRL